MIPVLLPRSSMPATRTLPPFLRRLEWVDFRSGLDDPGAFHRLVSGIQGISPGKRPSCAPSHSEGRRLRSGLLLLAVATLAAALVALGLARSWEEQKPLTTREIQRSVVGPTQEPSVAITSLVRIIGLRYGEPVWGSGFVVDLRRDTATIVTASHVIQGTQQLKVIFAVDLGEAFPAGLVLGADADKVNGLAAFQVRGDLPPGVTPLRFEFESRLRDGEMMFLLGFPQTMTPVTLERALADRRGTLLLLAQAAPPGFSGGPVVLRGGQVIGVVMSTDGQTTYAVNALAAHEALAGWRVSLAPPTEVESRKTAVAPRRDRQDFSRLRQQGPWTLRQGAPLHFADYGVTLSVTFSDDHGGIATLRIHPINQPAIVEGLLGPGGKIRFPGRSGQYFLSVVDWNPEEKTLELRIDPALEGALGQGEGNPE